MGGVVAQCGWTLSARRTRFSLSLSPQQTGVDECRGRHTRSLPIGQQLANSGNKSEAGNSSSWIAGTVQPACCEAWRNRPVYTTKQQNARTDGVNLVSVRFSFEATSGGSLHHLPDGNFS